MPRRSMLPPILASLFSMVATVASSLAADSAPPRLLIEDRDLPRIRHLLGLAQLGDAPATSSPSARFGACSADLTALRGAVASVADTPLPGELLAAAFLVRVAPEDPATAARAAFIARAMTDPMPRLGDPLETLIALDWAGAHIPEPARRACLISAALDAQPLRLSDSPLDPAAFRRCLAGLALVLIAGEDDVLSPDWADRRAAIVSAADHWSATTLPAFLAARGCTPTSPAHAASEENDTALAVELCSRLLRRDLWAEHGAALGRWLEHYALVETAHPALRHHFQRDDSSTAELLPVARWDALQPVTAALLAARTRAPAAAWSADRVTALMRASPQSAAQSWRWAAVIFDLSDVPRLDDTRLPAARRLDGAVVLRGGDGPSAVTIWIEAAQPILRSGQRFDAGHFLVRRGGHLTVTGGDSVTLAAAPAAGGRQRLGDREEDWDFEQYCSASIAHNTMLFHDPTRANHWNGRLYVPVGGQRPVEGVLSDFATPLAAQQRETGKLLAYGTSGFGSYVAVDLTAAYDPRSLQKATREFLFLDNRMLVLIDRAAVTQQRVGPIWVLNVPSRPMVDTGDLPEERHTAGADLFAGIWNCNEANYLRWQESDGAAWLIPVAPQHARITVVGGPARLNRVAEGPQAGRAYLGSSAGGFERLVNPVGRGRAQNAWYQLAASAPLGRHVGLTPHWGRIEITPPRSSLRHRFITVLGLDIRGGARPPEAKLSEAGDALHLSWGAYHARLELPEEGTGGSVVIPDEPRPDCPTGQVWRLPDSVQADSPLKTTE